METNSRPAQHAWAQEMEQSFKLPPVTLGPATTYSLRHDPRHLCFVLSRYKFCAKLLAGKQRVLEVACGDGIGLPLVAQSVGHVLAADCEPSLIEDNRRRLAFLANVEFCTWDAITGPRAERFDAAYLLDAIEHVHPHDEDRFLANICASLDREGVAIVGTPNATSRPYASRESEACHVNWKDHKGLRASLEKHFRHVFLFSMNDEVVHTGFSPMAHYLLALAVGVRSPEERPA